MSREKEEFRFEGMKCSILFSLYFSLLLREKCRFNERSLAIPEAMFVMVS